MIVRSHISSKEFAPVVRCTPLAGARFINIMMGIRLFGNGGVFAGTGIFWNRPFGVFRAYVTSARRSDLVLVETMDRKIVISPSDPKAFVESWRLTTPSASS